MPRGGEVGAQAYWFEAPVPQPPWRSSAELSAYFDRSVLMSGGVQITPFRQMFRAPGCKPTITTAMEEVRAQRRVAATLHTGGSQAALADTSTITSSSSATPPAAVRRGIVVEPRLTPESVIADVLHNAGAPPIPSEELLEIVMETLRNRPQTTEAPLASVFRRIAARANVDITELGPLELKKRQCKFLATDIPERGALLIADKEDAVFAAALRPKLPKAQVPFLTLLCPVSDPKPFRRVVRTLNRVARFECDFFVVAPRKRGAEEKEDELASSRASGISDGADDAESDSDSDSGSGSSSSSSSSSSTRSTGQCAACADDHSDPGDSSALSPLRAEAVRPRPLSQQSLRGSGLMNQSLISHDDPSPPKLRKRHELPTATQQAKASATGNPFLLLPRHVNRKQRRRKKGVKHSWRVRLIERSRRQDLYNRAQLAGDSEDENSDDGAFGSYPGSM